MVSVVKSRRRQKIKKCLGPDFESYGTVKKQRLSRQESQPQPESSSQVEADDASEQLLCDYCLQTSNCNRKGMPESLLVCTDCQAKAHPSCMDYSDDLARRARRSPWQCIDCKTCCLCEDAGDPDAMLFCDACDKGYHMTCHTPVIEDKPTGKWVCSYCAAEIEAENENEIEVEEQEDVKPVVNDCPPPRPNLRRSISIQLTDFPNIKLNAPYSSNLPQLSKTLAAEVPDASEWSIEDVAKYFSDIGFVDQSDTFREQEIDGKSLLLLKRSDVLMGLAFKLGPALKIYAHVQQLQLRGQPVQ